MRTVLMSAGAAATVLTGFLVEVIDYRAAFAVHAGTIPVEVLLVGALLVANGNG